MSSTQISGLTETSDQLVALVKTVTAGLVIAAAGRQAVSGVLISPDLIAIADHTLRREENIAVQLSTGEQTKAVLVGRAPGIDVAILRLERPAARPLPEADPAVLEPGSLAAVVGLTSDVGPSVSLGIIGAKGGPRRTWRGGTLDHFIKLDVNLYPSQFGGAVIDARGHLIGMATPALLRHSAVAVPCVTLQRVAEELSKTGRMRRGYIGIGLQPVAVPGALAAKAGIESQSGLMILSVEPGGPAEAAGLQLGDVLVSLGGKLVPDVDDLQDAVAGDAVGQTLEALVMRGGEPERRQITIAERPARGHRQRGE